VQTPAKMPAGDELSKFIPEMLSVVYSLDGTLFLPWMLLPPVQPQLADFIAFHAIAA